MGINEVKVNGEVVMSTRGDTVSEDNLFENETATNSAGNKIVGRATSGGSSNYYSTSDPEGLLDEVDYIPFYDTEDNVQPKKKTLFSNFINRLRSVFAEITGSNIDDPNTFRSNINTVDQVGVAITSGSDLNDYMTAGTYCIATDTIASSINNLPLEQCGKVIVFNNGNSGLAQFYLPNHSSRMFVRSYWEDAWLSWKELAKMDDLDEIQRPYYGVGTISGSAITSTISGFKLKSGAIVSLKFSSELPENATLNISSTGAKDIFYYNDNKIRNADRYGGAGVYTFIYDGTQYRVIAINNVPHVSTNSYVANTSGSIVETVGYDQNAYQMKYYLSDGVLKWNFYKDNAWRGDVDIIDNNLLQKRTHYLSQPSSQITANQDLDDFTESGTYQCNNSNIAVTLSNCPVKCSFKLVVDRAYTWSASEITQRIVCQNKNDMGYTDWIRVKMYNSSTWGKWSNLVYSRNESWTIDGNAVNGVYFDVMGAGGERGFVTFNKIANHLRHNYYNGSSWGTEKTIANLDELGASVAKIGKSILPIWSRTSNKMTHNGITFTFNPLTGEVTANGTATADANCILSGVNFTGAYRIPKGSYTLSGCPSGGSSTTYYICLNLVGLNEFDYGSPNTFTLDSDHYCNNNHNFYIRIISGQTVSNIVFKPMLRPAFTTADYEPCEDIHKGNCYVGTCTTAGATKDKEAYVDGYFVLRKGVKVVIRFSNSNTYSSTTSSPVTLNVNSTGAKNIWYDQNHSGAGNTGINQIAYGTADRYSTYVYDGNYWVWMGFGFFNYDSNNFLPLTGGTVTGEINYKRNDIDAQQSNNGVTSDAYHTYNFKDKNNLSVGLLHTVIKPNGNIGIYLQARNYNGSTTAVAMKAFGIIIDKSGNLIYDFNDGQNANTALGYGYGTCDTAAATVAKTVAISNYKAIQNGIVVIKFTNGVPASATLNINGQGAKSIYYKGSAITANVIVAGDTVTFIYDGTQYNLIGIDRTSTAMGNYLPLSGGTLTGILNLSGTDLALRTSSSSSDDSSDIVWYHGNGQEKARIWTANEYVKPTGLSYRLYKKDGTQLFSGRIPLTNTYVGTCDTAAGTKDKVATTTDDFALVKGIRVAIKYTYTNSYNSTSASPITLNVNSTGAKSIYYDVGVATGTSDLIFGYANKYIYYVYDGTYWVWDGAGNDANSKNFLRNDASSTLTASSPFLDLKASNIDITAADNGVSSTQYPAYIIQDKNGLDMTRLETVVETNGNIRTYLQACNYNTGTSAYFRTGITMHTNKSGDMWYSFSKPENINSATGMGYAVDSRSSAVAAVTATFSRYIAAYNSVVMVKFNYDVPANATLNINGQGAKNIYVNGSLIRANVIHAGEKATFVLNGNYDLVSIDKAASRELISQTLAAGATTVTFTGLPTSGNNLFDVYTSKAGLNYTAIDDSTSGQLTLTYPAQSSAVTVFLKIQQA